MKASSRVVLGCGLYLGREERVVRVASALEDIGGLLGPCWGCFGLGKGRLCGEQGWQEPRTARMDPLVVQSAGSIICAVHFACTLPWLKLGHWIFIFHPLGYMSCCSSAHSFNVLPGAPGQCPLSVVEYLSKQGGVRCLLE